MKLTSAAIDEFKKIYFEEIGIELSDVEAIEKATKLINLFQVILRPIPERTDH